MSRGRREAGGAAVAVALDHEPGNRAFDGSGRPRNLQAVHDRVVVGRDAVGEADERAKATVRGVLQPNVIGRTVLAAFRRMRRRDRRR
jgi:hypothetical protein